MAYLLQIYRIDTFSGCPNSLAYWLMCTYLGLQVPRSSLIVNINTRRQTSNCELKIVRNLRRWFYCQLQSVYSKYVVTKQPYQFDSLRMDIYQQIWITFNAKIFITGNISILRNNNRQIVLSKVSVKSKFIVSFSYYVNKFPRNFTMINQ